MQIFSNLFRTMKKTQELRNLTSRVPSAAPRLAYPSERKFLIHCDFKTILRFG